MGWKIHRIFFSNKQHKRIQHAGCEKGSLDTKMNKDKLAGFFLSLSNSGKNDKLNIYLYLKGK